MSSPESETFLLEENAFPAKLSQTEEWVLAPSTTSLIDWSFLNQDLSEPSAAKKTRHQRTNSSNRENEGKSGLKDDSSGTSEGSFASS